MVACGSLRCSEWEADRYRRGCECVAQFSGESGPIPWNDRACCWYLRLCCKRGLVVAHRDPRGADEYKELYNVMLSHPFSVTPLEQLASDAKHEDNDIDKRNAGATPERVEQEQGVHSIEVDAIEDERMLKEKEDAEKQRMENERKEQEDAEQQSMENERKEQEDAEKQRMETERKEQEDAENERKEQEDAEKQRMETERKEQEDAEKQRMEIERKEQEDAEKQRMETERKEQEESEKKKRKEQEDAEKQRMETERKEQEDAEKSALDETHHESSEGLARGQQKRARVAAKPKAAAATVAAGSKASLRTMFTKPDGEGANDSHEAEPEKKSSEAASSAATAAIGGPDASSKRRKVQSK
eukprot:6473785-Amphidinium_carterae.2